MTKTRLLLPSRLHSQSALAKLGISKVQLDRARKIGLLECRVGDQNWYEGADVIKFVEGSPIVDNLRKRMNV